MDSSSLTTATASALSALPAAPASTPRLSSPPLLKHREHDAGDGVTLRQRSRTVQNVIAGATNGSGENDGRDNASEVEGEEDGELYVYMLRWGYALVLGSTMCFLVGLWSILIGPYTDTSGLGILDTLAKDTYHKYLAVLLVPVTVCFVIVNWWGLKIFRHS